MGIGFKILTSWYIVLGLARTGIIFTRIQEGTQPGGLAQPGQTEQGIPYHVPSCCILAGGKLGGGNSRAAGARGGRRWERLCPFLLFVLCFPLICIVVVNVSLCLLFC